MPDYIKGSSFGLRQGVGAAPADLFEDGNFIGAAGGTAFSPVLPWLVEQGVDEFIRQNPFNIALEGRARVMRNFVESGDDAGR